MKIFSFLSPLLLASFLIGNIWKTNDRIPDWKNSFTLNSSAIKVSKNSARANSFMATSLYYKYEDAKDPIEKKFMLKKAEPFAKKACNIYPSYYDAFKMRAGIASALYNLGGSLDLLLEELTAIIEVRPDVDYVPIYLSYLNKREDAQTLKTFYYKVIGDILMDKQKNYSWAIEYIKIALELDPDDSKLRQLAYNAYLAIGKPEIAESFRD